MSARGVGIGGNKKGGGPRTVYVDNSFPIMKIALRKWVAEKFVNPSILDVYGGYGLMYKQLWRRYNYTATTGEALSWLSNQEKLDYDIYDVDPYSSPYEALQIISQKATKRVIGVICTDGCLRRQAQMRGKLPKVIQDICGWPPKDNKLMAAIYYQYPCFLKFILLKIFAGYKIKNLAVKYGIGWGKCATVYFAAVLEKRSQMEQERAIES